MRDERLNRLHHNTVKSIIVKQGEWRGYIAPTKVSPYHINSGWNLGLKVRFRSIDDFASKVANFKYYNCNAELGRGVAFYEISEGEL